MTRIMRPATAFTGSGGRQKRPRVQDKGHLEFIRTLPCVVTGKRPVEAAHIRMADLRYGKSSTGGQEKPSDRWVVPLHPDQHRKQHSMCEADYWHDVGIDPCAVALSLFGASGDEDVALEIIRRAQPVEQGVK